MGVLIFAAIVLSMLLPVLLATMIADLTRFQVTVLLAIGVAIGGTIALQNTSLFQNYYWDWTMPAAPAEETAFAAAGKRLHALRVAYADGHATPADLRQAEMAICRLPIAATDWVGRVTQKYLADSNRGEALSIEIRPHVTVRTAFFPDGSKTLIPTSSPLFTAVQAIQPADIVRFDGRIVGHAGACLGDPPIDPNERLRDPDFLFAFSRIARATKP